MDVRGSACALAALALTALAGCGGGPAPPRADNPPAARISSRVLTSGNVPRPSAAEFRAPIARYRAHVRTALGAMLGDVSRLRRAAGDGDLRGARAAWLAADARYETIGAAYGAFGDLDARIDGRPGGLQGGTRSPRFTGLHRVEFALWHGRSTSAAAPYARMLDADVRRLRARVAHLEIDPLEYVLRAHEVLEDSLHLQLSGVASTWSGAALVALRSNVRGTVVVLGSLRGMVARRNPQLLRRAELSIQRLQAALRKVRTRHGSPPRWHDLSLRDRGLVAGRTAAAAEQLAFVPELLDPRPPRPPQRAFGSSEGSG